MDKRIFAGALWAWAATAAPSTLPDPDPPPFDRTAYTGSGYWIDADGDCQDTRAEILIRDSRIPVIFRGGDTCVVDSGLWIDPYSGDTVRAATKIDIDFIVPLAEAHVSGAWAWSPERKRAYANYLGDSLHLLAVGKKWDLDKGDQRPDQWLPPDTAFRKPYARAWCAIKSRWGLTALPSEVAFLRAYLAGDTGVAFPEARSAGAGPTSRLGSRAVTAAAEPGRRAARPDGRRARAGDPAAMLLP